MVVKGTTTSTTSAATEIQHEKEKEGENILNHETQNSWTVVQWNTENDNEQEKRNEKKERKKRISKGITTWTKSHESFLLR